MIVKCTQVTEYPKCMYVSFYDINKWYTISTALFSLQINEFNYPFLFFATVLMVQFSQTAYSGSEASGNVRVMLLLRGGTSTSDITVTVMLSDISAKGKQIFVSLTS